MGGGAADALAASRPLPWLTCEGNASAERIVQAAAINAAVSPQSVAPCPITHFGEGSKPAARGATFLATDEVRWMGCDHVQ